MKTLKTVIPGNIFTNIALENPPRLPPKYLLVGAEVAEREEKGD